MVSELSCGTAYCNAQGGFNLRVFYTSFKAVMLPDRDDENLLMPLRWIKQTLRPIHICNRQIVFCESIPSANTFAKNLN